MTVYRLQVTEEVMELMKEAARCLVYTADRACDDGITCYSDGRSILDEAVRERDAILNTLNKAEPL